MKRIVLRERTLIPPFGEPARDLRILNKPLWLLQRDLLSPYCRGAEEVDTLAEIPRDSQELLVHRDNLFFNEALISAFISQAKSSGRACQLAFSPTDKAITTHALALQDFCNGVAGLHGLLRLGASWQWVGPQRKPARASASRGVLRLPLRVIQFTA